MGLWMKAEMSMHKVRLRLGIYCKKKFSLQKKKKKN